MADEKDVPDEILHEHQQIWRTELESAIRKLNAAIIEATAWGIDCTLAQDDIQMPQRKARHSNIKHPHTVPRIRSEKS
jgi:hypothetical protein